MFRINNQKRSRKKKNEQQPEVVFLFEMVDCVWVCAAASCTRWKIQLDGRITSKCMMYCRICRYCNREGGNIFDFCLCCSRLMEWKFSKKTVKCWFLPPSRFLTGFFALFNGVLNALHAFHHHYTFNQVTSGCLCWVGAYLSCVPCHSSFDIGFVTIPDEMSLWKGALFEMSNRLLCSK